MGFMGFGSNMAWGSMGLLFIILLVWSFFWKGLALWNAAKRGEMWWFIIMLVLNTAGILEIVYLFAVAKRKPGELFASLGMGKKGMPGSGPAAGTPAA